MPDRTRSDYDLCVVGAGPAGLNATVTAGERGLRVALVDVGVQPGGQYWRHPDERFPDTLPQPSATRRHGWREYRDLDARLDALVRGGRVVHLAGRHVWGVHPGRPFLVRATAAGEDADPVVVHARRIVLATGAYDRQLPVPGWTTPGVMAAGGVQALLAGHHVRAGRRVVVAGTGPFLLSVAAGLAEAGAEVVAVCEANALTGWAAHPLRTLQEPGKLVEGAGYVTTLLRHRVPFRTRTVITAVHGTGRVTGATLRRVDRRGRARAGSEERVDADLVALGWGFIPQLELAVGVGAATRVDVDGSLVAVVDDDQRSSVSGVYLAGEVTGVGGAVQSGAEGALAGLTAAADAGRADDPRLRARLRRRIARAHRFAVAMHRASSVPVDWPTWLADDTLVCRCEEVDTGTVRAAVRDLAADDPRDVRVTARPGMGMCQGRMCGFALSCLVSVETAVTPAAADLASLATRPLATPVRLAELAEMADGEEG